MTPNEIKQAMAELDGYTNIEVVLHGPLNNQYLFGNRPGIATWQKFILPDYTTRDAVIAVMEKWAGTDNDRLVSFCKQLAEVLYIGPAGNTHQIIRWSITAKPEELCEALLRAAGKWKDELKTQQPPPTLEQVDSQWEATEEQLRPEHMKPRSKRSKTIK